MDGNGVVLLATANNNNDEITFLFKGDICQMSTQEQLIASRGIRTGRKNVYPGVYSEEDFKKALQIFWDTKVDGHWNYREAYLKYKICTDQEFRNRSR